jgi:hypothetical protein
MATDLNSDDVSAALSLLNKAITTLKVAMAAKGYDKAQVYISGGAISVWNDYPKFSVYGKSFAETAAAIEALEQRGVWTPSLCEQTLGVREAA